MPKAETLATALHGAGLYWSAKGPSSRMMPIRAKVGVDELGGHLPLSSLSVPHGVLVLNGLRKRGLSQTAVASYYAAFRRMLALSGVSTVGWPGAGPVPRKVREPFPEDKVEELRAWLMATNYSETAFLLSLLERTGMRVAVEALDPKACRWGDSSVVITGKGGHQRIIPVGEPGGGWLSRFQESAAKVPYATHIERWQAGVKALGITTKRPTPHAVRHLYATKAWTKCRDLKVVQELLGHADVSTTAGYIGVDLEALREAVS